MSKRNWCSYKVIVTVPQNTMTLGYEYNVGQRKTPRHALVAGVAKWCKENPGAYADYIAVRLIDDLPF